MDQKQTPLYDALVRYHDNQIYSFHVPGHKDGRVFAPKAAMFFQSLLALDGTEVANLDDLYHPEGVIGDAQRLLSAYYHTRASYFLVNGSTVGNLTMVLAACAPGDVVLVQRDSHKSVFHALQLADVRPVFLAPAVDPRTGLAVGVEPRVLAEALARFPQAKALILTYPTYYGIAALSVRSLITAAHAAGLAVLVDEAHGPHFQLGAPVPPTTLAMGADLVVHSAHKMLPAMTMGAYLHINSGRVPRQRVARVRAMLQSSSPSYPIMASLDLARSFIANLSGTDFKAILERRDRFARELAAVDGLEVLAEDRGRFMLDPFKIVLRTAAGGFALQKQLIDSGIYPEMADPRHVLFTLGLTADIDYEPAVPLIRRALAGCARVPRAGSPVPPFPALSMLAGAYRVLEARDCEWVDAARAADRVAAEAVIPYPPGVPVILRGERITAQSIDLLHYWRQAGAVFQNEGIGQGRIMVYR